MYHPKNRKRPEQALYFEWAERLWRPLGERNVKLTRQNVDESVFVLVVWQTGTGELGRRDLHVRQLLQLQHNDNNLYIKVRSGDLWPVSECRTAGMSTDWIDNHVTLPSDGYSCMARVGFKAATDCTRVLRRLFTIVAVSATYGQIIASSLFTLPRRRIAVRGDVAMRKSAKRSLFL